MTCLLERLVEPDVAAEVLDQDQNESVEQRKQRQDGQVLPQDLPSQHVQRLIVLYYIFVHIYVCGVTLHILHTFCGFVS